jgi:hypothetical protein
LCGGGRDQAYPAVLPLKYISKVVRHQSHEGLFPGIKLLIMKKIPKEMADFGVPGDSYREKLIRWASKVLFVSHLYEYDQAVRRRWNGDYMCHPAVDKHLEKLKGSSRRN